MLNKLKLGDFVESVPTVGFNMENIKAKQKQLLVYDVGGQERLRGLWNMYYNETKCIIFVVDITDSERMNEVKKTLHEIVFFVNLYKLN